MKPLRFGILTLPSLPAEELGARWALVEELGYDSLWLPDHFVNPRGPRDAWFETWTLLSWLTSRTARVRVGTMVSNMTLRNPALLAKQAVAVDHVSRGRLVLGIGAGRPPADHEMTGLEAWTMRDRLARFKEFAAIVDLMLRQERTSWEGRFYTIRDAHVLPRPLQSPRPPLVIGGRSRAVLETVAAVGDAWNTNGGRDHTPEEALMDTRAKLTILREQWRQRQRDPEDLTLTFLVGQTRDTPLNSPGAFEDFVGSYRELGFSEFILFWLRDPNPDYALYDWIRDRAMLEKIALQWLPGIRKRLGPQRTEATR